MDEFISALLRSIVLVLYHPKLCRGSASVLSPNPLHCAVYLDSPLGQHPQHCRCLYLSQLHLLCVRFVCHGREVGEAVDDL